jgi:hypothetical protein
MPELLPLHRKLADAISAVSQLACGEPWATDTEFHVWRLFMSGRHAQKCWGPAEAGQLGPLLKSVGAAVVALGEWVAWDDTTGGPQVVPMKPWLAQFEPWLKQWQTNELRTMGEWLLAEMDGARADAEAATWSEEAGAWTVWRGTEPYEVRAMLQDGLEDGVVSLDRCLTGQVAVIEAQASDPAAIGRHIARWNPAAVLRRIRFDAEPPENILSLEHYVDEEGGFYTCDAATEEHDGATPITNEGRACHCGAADRVIGQLRLLARGYGWTADRR